MTRTLPEQYGAHRHDAARLAQRLTAEDLRRGEFLRAIDASTANCNDWETSFIASFLRDRQGHSSDTDHIWFTPRKRECVDRMIQRYGFRTLKPVPNAARVIPKAEPGMCGYLTRADERLNVPCGQAAIIKLNNGLELCAAHDEGRRQGIEKLRAAKMQRMRS